MKTTSIKFSVFYFFSVGLYAFNIAFFPIHCSNIGLSASEIGAITAIGTLATFLAAPIALQASYHLFSSKMIFIYSAFLATLFFTPLFYFTTFFGVTASWLLLHLAKRSADSLVEAEAVRISNRGVIAFERMRVFGSIGFVALIFLFGLLVDSLGQNYILLLGAANMVCFLVACFSLKSELPATRTKDSSPLIQKLNLQSASPFLLLIVVFCLLTSSHSIYYVYFSLYLDALQWSGKEISLAWNIGVVSEITVLLNFKFLQKHFSLLALLTVSCIATALRWLLLYLFVSSEVILLSQLLHGFSFGASYICAAKLVPKLLPDSHSDRGQGLLLAIGFGVGSFFGRGYAAYLARFIEDYTKVDSLFIYSFYLALASILLSAVLQARSSRYLS